MSWVIISHFSGPPVRRQPDFRRSNSVESRLSRALSDFQKWPFSRPFYLRQAVCPYHINGIVCGGQSCFFVRLLPLSSLSPSLSPAALQKDGPKAAAQRKHKHARSGFGGELSLTEPPGPHSPLDTRGTSGDSLARALCRFTPNAGSCGAQRKKVGAVFYFFLSGCERCKQAKVRDPRCRDEGEPAEHERRRRRRR
jgi:hypothetical protein